MYRALVVLRIYLIVFVGAALPCVAHAVTILPDEIEDFGTPCSLSVAQNGSVRTLSWGVVSGASTYKVGYRLGGSIVALAQVTGTSYNHTGWSPSECLEYVMVACNGSGAKICAAHVANVGNCPR